MSAPRVGDTIQVELPGWGETEATIEEIDGDTVWVSDRDGAEYEVEL